MTLQEYIEKRLLEIQVHNLQSAITQLSTIGDATPHLLPRRRRKAFNRILVASRKQLAKLTEA